MLPSPSPIDRRRASAARLRRQRGIAITGVLVVLVAIVAAVVVARSGSSGSVSASDFSGGKTLSSLRSVHEQFHSKLLGRTLDEIVILPKGYAPSQHRPLLVMLHGHGNTPSDMDNHWITDPLGKAGAHAPVVLLANGDTDSYYHDRRTGKWGSYITRELIPQTVHHYGLDPSRLAFGGISMGGFGALDLTRAEGHRICATGGLAPAIFPEAALTAPGAFDDAQDFARNDLLGAARANPDVFHGTPVFLGGGDQDPFHAGTSGLAAALQSGPSKVIRIGGAGGHSGSYWDPRMARYIGWYADQLAHCHGAA